MPSQRPRGRPRPCRPPQQPRRAFRQPSSGRRPSWRRAASRQPVRPRRPRRRLASPPCRLSPLDSHGRRACTRRIRTFRRRVRAQLLMFLPSVISHSLTVPSMLQLARTFESGRQPRHRRAGVAAQVQVLPRRVGFPHKHAVRCGRRGQQHAVRAELDRVDPIRVLLDLVQLFAGARVEKMRINAADRTGRSCEIGTLTSAARRRPVRRRLWPHGLPVLTSYRTA
jgi:hypothetical protein